MARIFYSLSGEGRGHATRARAIVDMLRVDHEVTLFAPEMAYALLSRAYEASSPNVRVRRLAGLRFHYRGNRLSYTKTAIQSAGFVGRMGSVIESLRRRIQSERPDFCITDFEPLLPRAARSCGVPFVSFDHQHFLAVGDFRDLPFSLRWKARALGQFTRWFYWGQAATIVSSFYPVPLRRGLRRVKQVGVLLRPEVLSATPETGDYLLVYLRRFPPGNLLEDLRRTGRPVIVYALGARPPLDNIEFREVDETGFLRDLAGCHALICNAGNQLVGEALYLRKPVLAIPEPGNFEQEINAYYLRQTGEGAWQTPREAANGGLADFLASADQFRARIVPSQVRGNEDAVEAIRDFLPAARRPAQVQRQPLRKRSSFVRRATGFARTVLRNHLRRDGYPRFLTYTVTFLCNARCVMCDSWKIPPQDELTIDDVAAIFDELPAMDAVRLTGGEPFVRRAFPDIARLAQERLKPLLLHVTTNGFLTQRIVRFCENRRHDVPLHLLVSIDGVEQKHNEIRGHSNAYSSAMETIRFLAPRQRALNLRLAVNQTIVDAEGIDHYRRLRDVLRPLGVRNNVVMAYDASATYSTERGVEVAPTEVGQFFTFGAFSEFDLHNLFQEVEKDLATFPWIDRVAKRYYLRGIANRLLGNKGRPNPKCVALNSHLRIFPNGDVPTCQFNSKTLGNLKRKSFQEVWRSQLARSQRDWVRRCPGCWAECEVLPSAIYTLDLAREVLRGRVASPFSAPSQLPSAT